MTSGIQYNGGTVRSVHLLLDDSCLSGDLAIPDHAMGIVLFVHGSGSSRHSPRNRAVAEDLQIARLATLLFDLLTPHEEQIDLQSGELRFNIPLLSKRVLGVTDWLTQQPETRDLPIGYFGASTGAAAALVAAAAQPSRAAAIVSRGGRPDLAASALLKVEAPTLLIVGSDDPVCLELNARAVRQLRCEKALRVISSASHLFEEPGALEQVSELATEWFCQHLSACSDRTSDQLPKLKSAE